MRRIVRRSIVAVALAILAGGVAQAELGTEPFRIRTTQDLVDLCAADPADPLYDDATNFCHGFIHGAWQYHEAQANGPQGTRLVCLSDPPPKRTDAIAMLITWTRSHPEHMSDPAVETMFRFLIEKWPCAEPAPAKKGAAK